MISALPFVRAGGRRYWPIGLFKRAEILAILAACRASADIAASSGCTAPRPAASENTRRNRPPGAYRCEKADSLIESMVAAHVAAQLIKINRFQIGTFGTRITTRPISASPSAQIERPQPFPPPQPSLEPEHQPCAGDNTALQPEPSDPA
jgi:hypothetical protein